MNKFKASEFQVSSEPDSKVDVRVVKLETAATPQVKDFELAQLKKQGSGTYSETKRKFGALAVTDSDRGTRAQKDRRFSLSPLLRDPLSIEEEELRRIEEKVGARVATIAEEAKAAAQKEGYRDGLKAGHDEAFKQFQKEGSERLREFERFVAECETAKDEIFRANERFLLELIFRVSRMVMLRELSTDKEYLLRLTRDLIERVGVKENVRIRIHPDDAATASLIKEGVEKSLGAMKNLNVEISNQVKRGGCIVETEWNAIDASIETQLQGVADALIGKVSTPSESGGA